MLKVLGGFKSCCFSYRAASAAECPANLWRFQNAAAFARLDRHMARCAEMMSLAGAALQFNRLERVEIGGTKGKTITAAIKAVHSDFAAAYERFQQVRTRTVSSLVVGVGGYMPAIGRHSASTNGGAGAVRSACGRI